MQRPDILVESHEGPAWVSEGTPYTSSEIQDKFSSLLVSAHVTEHIPDWETVECNNLYVTPELRHVLIRIKHLFHT